VENNNTLFKTIHKPGLIKCKEFIQTLNIEQEKCGLVTGYINENIAHITTIHEIRNIAKNPKNYFLFHPEDHYKIIMSGETILGMWHTHFNYPGYPSEYDKLSAIKGNVCIGIYLIYTSQGNEVYPYYWDGKNFLVI